MHERGARHLIDPSKLMASATRLYGEDMDRLWGDVLPGARGAGQRAAGRRAAACRRARARGRRRRPGTRRTTSATSIDRAALPSSAIRPASGAAPGTMSCRPRPLRISISRPGAQSARSHPGVGSGHAVSHALRAVPWCPDSLSGALRAARRVERARPSAPCGPVDRRRGARATVRGGGPTGHPAHGRRDGSRTVFAGPAGWTTRGRDSPGTGGPGWGRGRILSAA